jgi:hypothetical protein
MSGKEPPRAPVGRVQTGMASFCKPPPTAEQHEQQHLEEGQKFKQQVQKQRNNVQWMTEFSRTRLSLIFLSALGQKIC